MPVQLGDEFVVGAGVFSPALAFAEGVEAVGQLADGFALAPNGHEELTGPDFAGLAQGADQVMQRFPHRRASIRLRGPVGGVIGPFAQLNFAAARVDNTDFSQSTDADRFGAGQHVRFAIRAFPPAVLFKPVQAELAVGIEVVFGEEAVDLLQGGTDAHGRTVCFQHSGVFGEDRHAGANNSLREIDRGHRGMLAARATGHFVESFGEGGVQFADEFTAGDGRSVGGAFAADEDDAGGEGISIISDHATLPFSPHRPSASERKTGSDYCIEEGLPSGTSGTRVILTLILLKSVIDADWKIRMRLISEAMHSLSHAIEEKCFCFFLATMAVGCSN